MTINIILAAQESTDVAQKLISIIIIALLCMITYLIVINIKTLKRVINFQSSDKKSKIDDERYHELNNKIQLIIVVSSIIILIGGFFGYNSIDSINNDIRNKIKDYEKKIADYDTIIIKYNNLIPELETERDTILKSLLLTKGESEKTNNELLQLQQQYRLNAKTYFIKGVKIDQAAIKDNNRIVKVYFRDLPSSNIKLPVLFSKEPFISPINIGDGFIFIKKITKDHFEYQFVGTFEWNAEILSKIKEGKVVDHKINPKDATSFDLIIIEGV